MNEIEKTDLTTHIDAMSLVGQAVAQGAGVDQIDKLIELVKFHDQREALKKFNAAFTEAQAEFPEIPKTKKSHNSMYAPLDVEVRILRPVLVKHGLSFRHEVIENNDKSVTVKCILAHRAGHCESATLTGPADTSGSKNNIQAIGSSVTYLKRYTLEAVTGLVTTDDDDGNKGNLKCITEEQVANIEALIEEVGANKNKFMKWLKITDLSEIRSQAYDDVIKALEKKRNAPTNR